jgi:hypothetical protein
VPHSPFGGLGPRVRKLLTASNGGGYDYDSSAYQDRAQAPPTSSRICLRDLVKLPLRAANSQGREAPRPRHGVHRPATAPPLLTLGHEWGGAYAWLGSCGCTPPPRPLRGACRALQIWQVGACWYDSPVVSTHCSDLGAMSHTLSLSVALALARSFGLAGVACLVVTVPRAGAVGSDRPGLALGLSLPRCSGDTAAGVRTTRAARGVAHGARALAPASFPLLEIIHHYPASRQGQRGG